MKTTCKKIIADIYGSNGEYGATVKQHIAGCRKCAATAIAWEQLRIPDIQPEVSDKLDFAIRHQARRRSKSLHLTWILTAAAAACAMIVATVLLLSAHRLPFGGKITVGADWDNEPLETALFEIDTRLLVTQYYLTIDTDDDTTELGNLLLNDNSSVTEVIL